MTRQSFEEQEDAGIMTVHEVAKYLRTSESKVYRMVKNGLMPSFRFGKSWRFKRDLVDSWITKETESAFRP